jgi:hypothetical protein
MSEATNEGRAKTTKPQVLTFPNLDEPRAVKRNGKDTGKPKYSINLEFEPESEDLAAFKAQAVAVARAKWPGVDLKTLKFPFTSGDQLADKAKAKGKDREFSRGKAVFTARTEFQPNLSVLKDGKVIDLDGTDKGQIKKLFYSGCAVLVEVQFSAYDAVQEDGKPGVNAYVNKVLSFNKGKRLTGGASSEEAFKDYIGSVSDYDPTDGLDDEIPF